MSTTSVALRMSGDAMVSTEMPRLASVVPPADRARADVLGFLDRELARRAGTAGVVVLSVPAPLAAPEALLGLADSGPALLWDPACGRAASGLGAAWRIDLDGPRRFADLRAAADGLWNRLERADHPDVALAAEPRLYGGFAFAAGAASAAPWEDFGDGAFVLPRLQYERAEEAASLSVAIEGRRLDDRTRIALVAEAEAALLELALVELVEAEPTPGRLLEPSRARWTEMVQAIRAEIAAGRVEKIVAAQRAEVELAAPLALPAVLRRLARGLRASTRFAFRRDLGVFLGATPERLISLRGRRFETEALAGSIDPGAEHAAQLLASGKDQREHRLVVDAIVRRLEPLCAHLEVASEPRVRELREVFHLHTPISGTLAAPRHVLDLVEALHPTPAVGGVPTAESMRWIADHEDDARGWYAAPIGWFDARGDGDFAVALRSAVLRGREAHLYAGAGIVRDSDPDLEWVETGLKRQALLRALGAGA